MIESKNNIHDKRRPPLVVLTGPTAVGKTSLSIALCKAIGGAVISADSMQVYRKMDIGSAKIMPGEMDGVDHYLIDILNPEEEFNVSEFQKHADRALTGIYQNGKIPVVVGGTGFFIQSLLYQINFQSEDPGQKIAVRRELESFANEHGLHALHERLREIDPVSYECFHENNRKRVIRALEYFALNHRPISAHNAEEQQKVSPYNFAYFVLNDDREYLYRQIDRRVDIMLQKGLLEEVRLLREYGFHRDMVSMQGIGYKELFDYLDGKCSLEDAVYTIKRDSRHFAKRQITWFKRERDVIWIEKQLFERNDTKILNYILDILKEKQIYE